MDSRIPAQQTDQADSDPDCIEAANQFLDFCRKVWSTLESDAPASQSAYIAVEGGQEGRRAARSRRVSKAGRQRAIAPKRATKTAKQIVTPPSCKASDRVPKPGEPPVWGMFTKPQEPILSSPLQKPRKKQRISQNLSVPPTTQAAPIMMVSKLSGANAMRAQPFINEDVQPSLQPRGGTFMSSVKQNNKVKKTQQDERPLRPLAPAIYSPFGFAHDSGFFVPAQWPGEYQFQAAPPQNFR